MKKTVFAFFSLLFLALVATSSRPLEHGYKIGDYAADFELKNVDGSMVSMGMMRYSSAKGFIIVFTCNHCPFSKKYEQRIIALNKKYEALGFPLIAINPNDVEREPEDSFENMQKLAKEKGYNFPYLHDEPQHTAYHFGAEKTPHAYVLKKEAGKYKVCYIGAIDDDAPNSKEKKQKYVENAVDELLAGKPVSNTVTKAVGCGIKWKQ
jgi:glutathione peroxidase-family protein